MAYNKESFKAGIAIGRLLSGFAIADSFGKNEYELFVNYVNKTLSGNIIVNDISEIRQYAFYAFSSINNAAFKNCELICQSAFDSCSGLENIDIGKTVSIRSNAFRSCSNLKTVISPSLINIETGVFKDCIALEHIDITNVKNIYGNAFYNCYNLQINNLSLNDCFIGADAFYNCKNLTGHVTLSNVSIGDNAFYGCEKIEKLTLNNLNYAYNQKSSIFANCYSLKEINLYSQSEIAQQMFLNCSNLYKINAPDCENILYEAFSGCTSLVEVNFSNVNHITGDIFDNCTNLITIKMPSLSSLNYINVFGSCPNLRNLELLKCSYIMNYALLGCRNIKSFKFGSIFCRIESDAFWGMYNFSVYVPADLYSIYLADSVWSNYSALIVPY